MSLDRTHTRWPVVAGRRAYSRERAVDLPPVFDQWMAELRCVQGKLITGWSTGLVGLALAPRRTRCEMAGTMLDT